MKILVFLDNPAQKSLCFPWVNALRNLGHSVCVFSQMNELYGRSKIFSHPIMKRICLWSLTKKKSWGFIQSVPVFLLAPFFRRAQDEMNRVFGEVAQENNPAVVIVLKGLGLYPETLHKLRSDVGAVLVNFNGDDPHNFGSSNESVINSIPVYDCIFTWSQKLIPKLLADGAKRVEYLAFGCDDDVYKAIDVSDVDRKQYGSDIVFVGTWDREREKALETLADLNLGVWGPYWGSVRRGSPLKNCIRGGSVDMLTMGKIYGSSKVGINLMRPQNNFSHNMKTFEIPAMGGFMLAPRTTEHSMFFEEHKQVAYYDNLEEMRNKAIYFINHSEERVAMAALAQRKALAEHTYRERMRELLSKLEVD